ncbi:tetratricopeptide repeat protein [Streptomyces rectiviolaceus]|uniref:Tetratricopeptide repeat protein n=1 Tax=Streptomyces rectiviolaceus TaxID=332591 RepID=A0ABP6M9X6_9ACTN
MDAAVEAARRAVDRGVPGAVYNLAVYVAEAGHLEEAVDTYRSVMASGDLDACGNLGLLLEDLACPAEAERVYGEAINAGRTDLWLNLGNLFSHEGRLEEACAHGDLRCSIDPASMERSSRDRFRDRAADRPPHLRRG